MSDADVLGVPSELDLSDDDVVDTAAGSVPDEATAPAETDDTDETPVAPTEGAEAVTPVVDAADSEPDPVAPFVVQGRQVQPYEIPGVTFNAKTNTIHVADERAGQRVSTLLAHGRWWETQGRNDHAKLTRQLQQKGEADALEVTQAKVYVDQFKALMQMSEQELYDFCLNSKSEWPRIEAQALRADAERLRAQATAGPEVPEVHVDTLIDEARTGVSQLVEDVCRDQAWATPEARVKVTAWLSDMEQLDRFVLQTARDIPERGVRAGQWVADWDRAAKMAQAFMQPYADAHAAIQQTTQRAHATTTVASNNQKALAAAGAQRAKAPPPAPSTPSKAPKKNLSRQLDDDWAAIIG